MNWSGLLGKIETGKPHRKMGKSMVSGSDFPANQSFVNGIKGDNQW